MPGVKFLADAMLGKLARWLRIFGYDVELASDSDEDSSLMKTAKLEKRVLLTRDKKLGEKGAFHIKGESPEEQVVEVAKAFKLEIPEEPVPDYCSLCNGRLLKERELWVCEDCKQEYWKGSHWRNIRKFSGMVRKELPSCKTENNI
jgi:uncharacterized protein with PIN domain